MNEKNQIEKLKNVNDILKDLQSDTLLTDEEKQKMYTMLEKDKEILSDFIIFQTSEDIKKSNEAPSRRF